MPTNVKDREEQLTEADRIAQPTVADAEFWPSYDPYQLTLQGEPTVVPAGTFVVAVCRLQGRLLLKTEGAQYRWADASFRFTSKA